MGFELDTLTPDRWSLHLHYRRSRTDEALDYPILLTTTRPNFGGLRWWFACPLVKGGTPCGRRAAKLYLPLGGRTSAAGRATP